MAIKHTFARHTGALLRLEKEIAKPDMRHLRYVLIVVDGPEAVARRASYTSTFNDADTHKIFEALAAQTGLPPLDESG